MKKTAIIAIALAGLVFAACKKENYTCECKIKTSSTTNGVSTPEENETEVTAYRDVTKKQLEVLCGNHSSTKTTTSGTVTTTDVSETTCTVK